MTKLVRTPVPGFTGDVGNVHFDKGVAKVADNAQELSYFTSAGYTIDDFDDALDAAPQDEQPALEDLDVQGGTANPDAEPPQLVDADGDGTLDVLPRKNASAEEWRRFAVEHGGMSKDEADGKSRDELVEHFTKEDDQ